MTNALFLSTAQKTTSLEELQKQLKDKPGDMDRLFQLCSQEMMQSQFAEAMDVLLQIIKLDYTWRDGIASLCMRGLFIMLGKDNSTVIEYRQKLIDQQSH